MSEIIIKYEPTDFKIVKDKKTESFRIPKEEKTEETKKILKKDTNA